MKKAPAWVGLRNQHPALVYQFGAHLNHQNSDIFCLLSCEIDNVSSMFS
jgi:hypothetical protein